MTLPLEHYNGVCTTETTCFTCEKRLSVGTEIYWLQALIFCNRHCRTLHESRHEGRPIVRKMGKYPYISVVCPYGHSLHAMPMKEWAGSWLEAKATDPTWTVTCFGAIA
jgi:hypothetical protein